MLSLADWLLACEDNVEFLILCFRIILLLKVYCYYGNVYVTDSIMDML